MNPLLETLFQQIFSGLREKTKPDSYNEIPQWKSPMEELQIFQKNLERAKIPFLENNPFRAKIFPQQPTCPEYKFIYYFIPNSGWGSENEFPEDPWDNKSAYCSDGVGLNLNCPARLHKGLKAIDQMNLWGDEKMLKRLRSGKQHIATIEELLWSTIWKIPTKIEKIPEEDKPTPDFKIITKYEEVTLEAKFLPSDWLRIIDENKVPISLDKAKKQLKNEAGPKVIGLSTIKPPNENLVHYLLNLVETSPTIDAIIIKPWVGQFSILSRDEMKFTKCLKNTYGVDIQPEVFIAVSRPFKHKAKATPLPPTPKTTRGVISIKNKNGEKFIQKIMENRQGDYASDIVERKENGEPIFETHGKYLMRKAEKPC
jgi:hypothetical protein